MMRLVIGNRNYSSWSLRGWLVAKLSGLPFDLYLVWLDQPTTVEEMSRWSPTRRVPVLHDGPVVVWDTVAITEYLYEKAPQSAIWPSDVGARARARSIVAEMHSSFQALRGHLPMNIRRAVAKRPLTDAAQADVDRICRIWQETRDEFGSTGPFLFGDYSAADAFYAPVAHRFRTYRVAIPAFAEDYVEAQLNHPFLKEWSDAALVETAVISYDEVE